MDEESPDAPERKQQSRGQHVFHELHFSKGCTMKRNSISIAGSIIIGLCLAVSMSACKKQEENLSFTTEYQAVFIDNGQVYFGKLEKAGSEQPLLKEVYYIGQRPAPDGKGVANILLKRGNEWHGPDSMYITRNHIVMIEPVSPTSRVAELIKELKAKGPETKPEEKPAK
jgi:hypothetical protein